jgi:hypothetical protein
MKKLLIFILVLGLSSLANATMTNIEISIDGATVGASYDVLTGDTISVEMYSNNEDPGSGYLGLEDNALYTLTNQAVTTNAGDQGGYTSYSYYGYTEIMVVVSKTASGTITPGVMFMVDFNAGSSTGTVDVYLASDESGYPTVDTLTINIIPEPMTIALLGLGGLFLRRRR